MTKTAILLCSLAFLVGAAVQNVAIAAPRGVDVTAAVTTLDMKLEWVPNGYKRK